MTTAAALDPVATTSRVTAAMRATESERPDRLFADPFAAALAGDRGRELAAHMATAGPHHRRPHAVRRRRRAAGARHGHPGVTLDLPAGTTVFEMDRPELLDLKAHLLEGAATRAARVAVGADLTSTWADGLRAAGHDPTRPTCWVVEGLLQYLPEPAVRALLEAVTSASAPGSHLLLDVVGARLLRDSPRAPCWRRWKRWAARGCSPPTIPPRCSRRAAGRTRSAASLPSQPVWPGRGVRQRTRRVRVPRARPSVVK